MEKIVNIKEDALDLLLEYLHQGGFHQTDAIADAIEKNHDYLIGNILDSLDLVEYFLMLEKHFHIKIPDQDQIGLLTFASVVRYIDSKLDQP